MSESGVRVSSFFLSFIALLLSCSIDPNSRKINYLRSGEDYYRRGRFQEAVIQFQNAVQIDPNFAEAHYQLARSYISLKNTEAAYRSLMEVVTLDPKNFDAQLQLGTILVANKEFDQAEAAAKRVLAADPTSAGAHTILG